MSNIPAARQQLRDIAHDLHMGGNKSAADKITTVIDNHMTRVSPISRAPSKRVKMTAKIGAAIRAYYKAHPNALQEDVARMFNVDGGRVSEARRGLW